MATQIRLWAELRAVLELSSDCCVIYTTDIPLRVVRQKGVHRVFMRPRCLPYDDLSMHRKGYRAAGIVLSRKEDLRDNREVSIMNNCHNHGGRNSWPPVICSVHSQSSRTWYTDLWSEEAISCWLMYHWNTEENLKYSGRKIFSEITKNCHLMLT